MTSDRGSQFVSDLWLEFCSLMGIARDPTTSYHPQHNGKIERMNRCLKNSLRARLIGRVNWLSELPWVMLGLRAASNLDTGVSPSILVTGQQPTLPGQLVVQRPTIDDASDFGRKLASAMAAQTFHEHPWHEKRRGRSYVGKAHKNCIIGQKFCLHHITGTAFIIRLKYIIVENSETFKKIYSFMQFK